MPISPPPPAEFAADAPRDRVARALQDHGCALVRAILPVAPLRDFFHRAAANFVQLDGLGLREEEWVNDVDVGFVDATKRTVSVADRDNMTLPAAVWSACAPGFYADHIEVFDHSVFKFLEGTALTPILAAVLGGDFAFSFNASRLRRHSGLAATQRLHLHQDASSADYGLRHVVTAWIPLCNCGVTAPGLQAYPQRMTDLLPVKRTRWFIDDQHLGAIRESLWRPVFAVGDLFLFDAHTIHGTHVTETMPDLRISLDVRAHAPGRPPRFMDGQPEYAVVPDQG
ncbi:MAG: phytanoyl-CoA dioxygenase family protein [Alphaproteobacteria bacterium]|nr:phytanoyl-CoA dioxygenase family protein [Alphaproteobacteria bacterium]